MPLATSEHPLAERFDAVLLDLDGVVYRSDRAVDHAVDVLDQVSAAGRSLAFLTNSAARTPQTVADHLRRLGLSVDDAQVITSAEAISDIIAERHGPGGRIMVCGGPGLRQALTERGLVPVDSLDDDPIAVVQGYAPDVGWRDLAEVSYAVEDGLPWYVSNTDLTVPTSRGVAPGNGSLVQTVRIATGSEPEVIAGKPYAPLFEASLSRLGSARPLMIGDRLDTDIAGARAAGVPAMAVLTGVSSLKDLASAAPEDRPDYVAHDLRGLLTAHLPVEVDGDRASCGTAVARLGGDGVVVESSDDEVSGLRAALALAWARRDATLEQ